MPLLRLVRDRTKRDEDAFDVIQASGVVMTISVRASVLASSPELQWMVAFAFGRRKLAVIGIAGTIDGAFDEAVRLLKRAGEREPFPMFTLQEWEVIRDALDRYGVFDPVAI
jgi:hypothetical protein